MENFGKIAQFVALMAVALFAGWAVRRLFGGPVVPVADVARRLDGGEDMLLLDVRTPEEFRAGHIRGALNLPLHDLGARLASLGPRLAEHADTPVVVVCRSGSRAHAACRQLKRAGLRDIRVMSGGMIAWSARRLPVAR